MAATDLTARLTEWVTEAINSVALGEEFPFAVTPGYTQVPGGQLPAWTVMILMRSPILGSAPLCYRMNVPPLVVVTGQQAHVRETVHEGIGALRNQFTGIVQGLRTGQGPSATPVQPPGKIAGN